MSVAVETIPEKTPPPARRRGRHTIQSAVPVGTRPRPLRMAPPPPGSDSGPSGSQPTARNLNGVDLTARSHLAADVAADPGNAGTAWQAEATWSHGLRSQARVRGFDPIQADGPVDFGGTDTAPHPVEALLAAMANCLVAAYAAHASRAGIPLTDLRVRVSGELNLDVFLGLAQGHAGFHRIGAAVTLRGTATPEQLAELHETVVATSPIGHTIANVVPIRVHLS